MQAPRKLTEALKNPVFLQIKETAEKLKLPVYVVGGFVRDFLLTGQEKDEIDLVVVGDGVRFARALSKHLNASEVAIFKRFGTAMMRYKNKTIEVASARKESYNQNSRKPVVEVASLEEDQKRRDFTVNAMMIAVHAPEGFGTFIDPFNGFSDLRNKIIKTPLAPEKTFYDDPLRMLRAIRFATRLDFDIHPETYEGIRKEKDRIKIISQERITEELNKILLARKPSKGFYLLDDTGLLEIIFPELVKLKGVEECHGKFHKDNFKHTLQVLDNVAELDKENNLWLRWAALLHDIAKPLTKKCEEGKGWTFHQHEVVGSKMVPKIFRRMRLPLNEKMKYVKKLVYLHLRPIPLAQTGVTDKAVRRLMIEAGEIFDDLLLLCKADITTKSLEKKEKYLRNLDKVIEHAREVEEKDKLRNWKPPITGEDIMEYFSLKPSRIVGEIKKRVREAILEGEVPDERNAAYEYMKKVGKELLKEQQ